MEIFQKYPPHLSYSNYLGTEGENAVSVRRFYHNLYGIFQLNDKIGLITGMDYGTQQTNKGSEEHYEIMSPVMIAQYKLNPQWALAGRLEFYEDKNAMIISTGTPEGFKTSGYSLNIDYAPSGSAVIRLEGKVLESKNKIFMHNLSPVNHSATITTSIAVSF